MAEVSSTIGHLEAARQVVLSDASHYSIVVPSILPIIGSEAPVEVRRWGSDFLAEAFASPMLPSQAKEALSVQVLQLLSGLLETPNQDEAVVKSVVQTAASIYGPIFRHITNHPNDALTWNLMSTLKSNILRCFDVASTGVRICCVRFAQRVVQVQTHGVISDPRRQDQNEVSLAIVPRDHPLIPIPHLEAEASGLLDRLLAILYEEHGNVLIVDATLNGFAGLVRLRPSAANKIVSAVLSFNPFKVMHPQMTPRERVAAQSLERTASAFLLNYSRKNQNSPMISRIHTQLSRLKQLRMEYFDTRKRGPPLEPSDGLDRNKRIRLGTGIGSLNYPPLPPGPVSVAQLFTLTTDEALRTFDVTPIPIDLVVSITLPFLQQIDPARLADAINAIRGRFLDLSRTTTQTPLDAPEDPAYEPPDEYAPREDDEQRKNAMAVMGEENVPMKVPEIDLGPFELPQPPPLSYDEAELLGKAAISRVFSMMSHIDEAGKAAHKPPRSGFNRLAGSSFDRAAWITVITRLATRASPEHFDDTEPENEEAKAVLLRLQDRSLGDGIRETLWKYVVEDFRRRIDVAISWLNEEWYNDRVTQSPPRPWLSNGNTELKEKAVEINQLPDSQKSLPKPNYEKWVLKLLDAIMPYLDANDKVLVRFLGEIPEISLAVLQRVKDMARDPDRVSLTVKALYYLIMFKPPAKEASIDALEDLYRNYPDARTFVKPHLAKLRPSAVAEGSVNGIKEGSVAPKGPPSASSTPVPAAVATAS